MEIENNYQIIIKKRPGPVPKPRAPKPEKPVKVNKTDDPNYYVDYYTNHKENYKEYSEKAKEKVYHCDFCNIDTAFRHHLRHSRTKSHIKKALQNVI